MNSIRSLLTMTIMASWMTAPITAHAEDYSEWVNIEAHGSQARVKKAQKYIYTIVSTPTVANGRDLPVVINCTANRFAGDAYNTRELKNLDWRDITTPSLGEEIYKLYC